MKNKGSLLKILLLNTTVLCGYSMAAQQVQDGLVYYGGDKATAHLERYTMVGGQRVSQPHGDLPEHKGFSVHYAEAFYKNQAPVPLTRQAEHAGGYTYDGIITDNFHPTVRAQHLIYSDGANIFQPHVTQELWTRAHGTPTQEDVRFLISSHKDNLKLNWTPGTEIQTTSGHLPAGLYQFISADNLTEQVPHRQNNVVGVRTNYFRLEKWQKVGTDQFYQIKVPAQHLVSVPGMQEYVVNDFPEEPKDFTDLKGVIDTYELTVANNVDLLRPVPRIIFLGDARVGKDALAHYYAGVNLSVKYNRAFRPARIELQGAPQLGTLSVVSGIIGSRAAGSYFDATGQRVIWTTPGADGIEEPLNDILNVLSLKTLLTKSPPSKYVLTIKESSFFEANYKNLNEVLKRVSRMFGYRVKDDGTVVLGRNDDLKHALSLNISQAERSTKEDLADGTFTDDHGAPQPVKGMLRNILEIMKSSPQNFDAGGMALLEYLVDHPERVSFFSVPDATHAEYTPRDPLNTRLAIQESIDATNGGHSRYLSVQRPEDIQIVFKTETYQFIQKVLEKLNNQVTKYLSEDGVQKIWALCNKKIQEHEGTADALRDKLLTFSNTFNNAVTQPLDDLVRDIETLLGTDGITRNIRHLRYLHEKLGVKIDYARDQWLAPLVAVMNNIRYLSSKDIVPGNPTFDPLKGVNYFFDSAKSELTLVGYLVGLTDVVKLVEKNHTRSGITGLPANVQLKKLNIFALRSLLADGTVTVNEGIVTGFAPETVQTVKSVSFDLSGRGHAAPGKAAANTSGAPGLHGRNGGSLVLVSTHFKDAYKAAHPQDTTKFEIMRDGGSGQDGQEGGDSTSVPAAIDGNTGAWYESSSHPVSVGRGTWDPEKDRYHVSTLKVKGGSDNDRAGHFGPWYKDHLSIDYVWKEYRQAGITGTKGSRGLAGGVKGLKGHQGLIDVTCLGLTYTIANNPPQDGSNGSGGAGSAGGPGGRVNYKITYNYRPGKYNHNGTEMWANAESGTSVLGDGGRYREDTPRLLDSERGPTGAQGDSGQAGGNTTGQAAQSTQITAAQLQAIKDSQLQLYSTRYYSLAADPVKQKLLGLFTGLPSQ